MENLYLFDHIEFLKNKEKIRKSMKLSNNVFEEVLDLKFPNQRKYKYSVCCIISVH